jgi:septal ring factor EnvC (AmiA/AmiB activator)
VNSFGKALDDYDKSIKEINKIVLEIKRQSKKLASIRKSEKELSNKLLRIESKIKFYKKEIKKLNSKIKKLKIEKDIIYKKIYKTEKEIEIIRNEIKKANAYLINNQGILKLKILLFTKSYHETINNMEIIEAINKKLFKKLMLIKKKYNEIFNMKSEIDMQLLEIEKYNSLKEKVIEDYTNELNKYLKVLTLIKNDKKDTEEYIKLLEERKKSLAHTISNIKELVNQEEGSDKLLESQFYKLKGHHIWPVDGNILEYFGPKKIDGFEGTINNKGIKISVEDAGYVHVIFDGTVKYIDTIRGYGDVVIVQHDDFFYTLYANLDEVTVHAGEKLKKNDKIGLIDVDLKNVTPYLYFEIRKTNKAVDPLLWLSAKKD